MLLGRTIWIVTKLEPSRLFLARLQKQTRKYFIIIFANDSIGLRRTAADGRPDHNKANGFEGTIEPSI